MCLYFFRTTVAIAGDDFAMIASDTRMTHGYSILSRDQKKVFKLTNQTMLASTGCWADVLTLNKVLEARLTVNIILFGCNNSNKILLLTIFLQLTQLLQFQCSISGLYVRSLVMFIL